MVFTPIPVIYRLFGSKCEKCGRSFGTSDLVMRAKNKIYHLECFRCVACEKRLVPGDEFALRQDGLFCKEDHQVEMVHVPDGVGNPGKMKPDAILENNNNLGPSLLHNTSNSSEDNSESKSNQTLMDFFFQLVPYPAPHFAGPLLNI